MSTKSRWWLCTVYAHARLNGANLCGNATYLKHNPEMNKCTFASICMCVLLWMHGALCIVYRLTYASTPSICPVSRLHALANFNQNNSFYVHINEQIELCLEFNIAEDTVLRMFSAHPCIFIEYRKCLMVHALVAFMLHQANTHIYVARMGSNRNNPKSKEDPTTRTITSPTDHFIKTLRKGIKIDLSTLNGVHMQQLTPNYFFSNPQGNLTPILRPAYHLRNRYFHSVHHSISRILLSNPIRNSGYVQIHKQTTNSLHKSFF